jgi:hypothetical protein
MGERGGGMEGRKEGEVQVPHLLARPDNFSDKKHRGVNYTNQSFYFIDIAVS